MFFFSHEREMGGMVLMGRLLVDDQQLLELLLVARWLVVRVGKGMLGYGEIERERKKIKERR